jgi:hypothetical protein
MDNLAFSGNYLLVSTMRNYFPKACWAQTHTGQSLGYADKKLLVL